MTSPTAKAILDCAQSLCQKRGFGGFSYRDIADQLGIKTASIHYHFASKEVLGEALVARYREDFISQLSKISMEIKNPEKRIQRFTELLGSALRDENKICLCMMFASELETIGEGMKSQVRGFFDDVERWLEQNFSEGKGSGLMKFHTSAKITARNYLAALQGLAIWARAFDDPSRYDTGRNWLAKGMAA